MFDNEKRILCVETLPNLNALAPITHFLKSYTTAEQLLPWQCDCNEIPTTIVDADGQAVNLTAVHNVNRKVLKVNAFLASNLVLCTSPIENTLLRLVLNMVMS